VIVAAYTGLTVSEMRGRRWADIEDKQINVSNSYWKGHKTTPKTVARSAAVPLLENIARELELHGKKNPGTKYVFADPVERHTISPPGELSEFGKLWRMLDRLRSGTAGTRIVAASQQRCTRKASRIE
jgi:hypothetical protein